MPPRSKTWRAGCRLTGCWWRPTRPIWRRFPSRGKQNQPAYVRYVAEHIAQLRGLSFEEVAQATTDNFFRLFAKARQSAPDTEGQE